MLRFSAFLLLSLVASIVSAIKFDLEAYPSSTAFAHRKCLSQHVGDNTMVIVTVKVGEGYNQRVDLEIYDDSESINKYATRRDVGEQGARLAFSTHADASIFVCFTNTLSEGFNPGPNYKRTIDVDYDIGAEAMDYSKIAKAEKLAPLEVELRKLEKVVQEIWDEMEYLKTREAKMRDTNESTNERVQWFSIITLLTLISLGTWQVMYLRRFFKRKRLID
ncbi:emp24/gp25L/p24 family/GOLD-domain-containing protein [Umbelopsis sp. PMI_123]|nr:emp24/gp25L/p24 family/GOLD-domain-containing protein [Umbelopsis sp. PMI_123]